MRIYLSGPITGHDDGNRDTFAAAQLYLECKGHAVSNPHALTHDHAGRWEDYMRVDVREMLTCDSLFMLDGWQLSRGATIEHHLAVNLALPIRYQGGGGK